MLTFDGSLDFNRLLFVAGKTKHYETEYENNAAHSNFGPNSAMVTVQIEILPRQMPRGFELGEITYFEESVRKRCNHHADCLQCSVTERGTSDNAASAFSGGVV